MSVDVANTGNTAKHFPPLPPQATQQQVLTRQHIGSSSLSVDYQRSNSHPLVAPIDNIVDSSPSPLSRPHSRVSVDRRPTTKASELKDSWQLRDAHVQNAARAHNRRAVRNLAQHNPRFDPTNRWLVEFHPWVALEMFIVHGFGPLAIPYIYWKYGWTAVVNLRLHMFWGGTGPTNWTWVFFVTNIALYNLMETKHIATSEVFLATALFLARNCIIACKYGYFSPAELVERNVRILTSEELNRTLMVPWILISPEKQLEEIDLAEQRSRLNLDEIQLTFQLGCETDEEAYGDMGQRKPTRFNLADTKDTSSSSLNTSVVTDKTNPKSNSGAGPSSANVQLSLMGGSISGGGTEDVDPTVVSNGLLKAFETDLKENPELLPYVQQNRIPGRLFVQHMIDEANQVQTRPKWLLLGFLLGLIHALIPVIVRGAQGAPPFGNSPQEIIIVIGCIYVSWPNFAANLLFVLVGVVDYRRRVYLMQSLSALYMSSFKVYQEGSSQFLPLLCLKNPKNVAHFLDIRSIFKEFGLQFFVRIQMYSSLWVFFLFLFVAFLFYQILWQRTAELISIVFSIYDLAIVIIAFFLMLIAAKNLNSQHQEHRRVLLKRLHLLERFILNDEAEEMLNNYATNLNNRLITPIKPLPAWTGKGKDFGDDSSHAVDATSSDYAHLYPTQQAVQPSPKHALGSIAEKQGAPMPTPTNAIDTNSTQSNGTNNNPSVLINIQAEADNSQSSTVDVHSPKAAQTKSEHNRDSLIHDEEGDVVPSLNGLPLMSSCGTNSGKFKKAFTAPHLHPSSSSSPHLSAAPIQPPTSYLSRRLTGNAHHHGSAQTQEYTASLRMLRTAIQVVETEDHLAPVKILGFDAGDNFLRGLVGVAGSAFVVAVRLLTQ